MIKPIIYDPGNFQPICIDNGSVSDEQTMLAALSPSFSPMPPDGNKLHAYPMELKRTFAWRARFRNLDFESAAPLEEFVNIEFSNFIKTMWHQKSTREPPPLPKVFEDIFNKNSTIMQPSNWYK